MDWDVLVVGAGPAGCFAAMQIAASGFKVLVIEEHKEIGRPVQCSGLISPRAVELAGVDKSIVLNHLSGMHVYSSLGTSLQAKSSHDLALAVDRAAFDQELAAKAENAGALLLKGVKAESAERIPGGFRLTATGQSQKPFTLTTKMLIGADGTDSHVSKWLGLKRDNPKAVMFAADVRLHNPEPDLMNVFLGQDFAPGWFGWIIPLNGETCRVGTGYALVSSAQSPRQLFGQFTDHYPQIFKDYTVMRYTGGNVPLGSMPKIYASGAMLVGDAACQTKPISGGGIFMGLRGAQLCAKTAVEALCEENLSEESLSRYQALWDEEMKEEADSAMKLRKSFLNLTNEDIDRILRFLNKPKYQTMISQYGDIDYPSGLARRLISFSPWINQLLLAALKLADSANFI